MSNKKGIYLVANKKSQAMCQNLIFSIRESGCFLPIRIIHFGGKVLDSPYILKQAELVYFNDFSEKAQHFIQNLRSVLTACPLGFLYRYLAWFSDWDEFIYSDNDVVALCDWSTLFDYLPNYDLVHADEEYTTNGIYNYFQPENIRKIFGDTALESAITAGHIVVRRNDSMITDINRAIQWFKDNPEIPQKHDQSLLHIASLIGRWKILNLCKAPHHWLSSWAGDYTNSLQVIQQLQLKCSKISHIHYSGSTPKGNLAIQDLLFASETDSRRLSKLAFTWVRFSSKYEHLIHHSMRVRKFLRRKLF